MRAIDRALEPTQKITGFHLYCSSDSVQEQMEELLEKRENDRIAAADSLGKPFEPELLLNAHHAIKCQLWAGVPEVEKKKWKKMAEESSQVHHHSSDR
jgi:hypothetical protein